VITYLMAGSGDDVLLGGRGRDWLVGGGGNDRLLGNADNDQISGEGGSDTIRGGSGNDRLYGGPKRDDCSGGSGQDYVAPTAVTRAAGVPASMRQRRPSRRYARCSSSSATSRSTSRDGRRLQPVLHSAAIRRHMEREVIATDRLSWTSFVVLWVLWVWGEMESRDLAAAVGISRPTSTGVVTTLERRKLVRRRRNSEDGRMVRVSLTSQGLRRIEELFPRFNAEEVAVTAHLGADEQEALAAMLRSMLRTVDDGDLRTGGR
jgi:DNA-binding MarR family transcriptional regulator